MPPLRLSKYLYPPYPRTTWYVPISMTYITPRVSFACLAAFDGCLVAIRFFGMISCITPDKTRGQKFRKKLHVI